MSCKIVKKNKAKLYIVSHLSFNKDKNMKSNLRPRAEDYHPVSYGPKLIPILFLCASVSRPGFGKSYPAFLCACFSVSAGCLSVLMNPQRVPDHPFGQFSVEAPCSRPLPDPALAF